MEHPAPQIPPRLIVIGLAAATLIEMLLILALGLAASGLSGLAPLRQLGGLVFVVLPVGLFLALPAALVRLRDPARTILDWARTVAMAATMAATVLSVLLAIVAMSAPVPDPVLPLRIITLLLGFGIGGAFTGAIARFLTLYLYERAR
ncbi:hypothetical protein ACFQ1E_01055 [Sphingomonas canadensis]|uniref:DUF1616 domain-containing protein n=1 Tax=Sphingomonas canadensis TaxID=1219257 RepID=A0ABW3H6K3_9SPHN|nr:hypothetical protein [Sphingomonas canadensis]MCW3835170.1 hypothetical protein [Sphingomonas canadensis]